LFSRITGIKTDMLLIIVLGLIAKLKSVSGDCNAGTSKVDDYDFLKVGVRVLTGILKQEALKPLLGFIFYLWINRAY
jgi:hypothetical protein